MNYGFSGCLGKQIRNMYFEINDDRQMSSGTEDQFVIMPQDKLPYVIILGFRAKGHFAHRQFSVVNTLKDADPEGFFKEYRQACFHDSESVISSGSALHPRYFQ